LIGFLESGWHAAKRECAEARKRRDPMWPDCGDCAHSELCATYSIDYGNWVSDLERGLDRLELAPHLSRRYTLEDIDMMAVIRRWRRSKQAMCPMMGNSHDD